jgi:hypothetical protein
MLKDQLRSFFPLTHRIIENDHILKSPDGAAWLIYNVNFCFHVLTKSEVLFLWRWRHLVSAKCVHLFRDLTMVISKRWSLKF